MKKFDVKKTLAVFLVSIMAALLAGIYGMIHDHISYSISNEYYTKYRFLQYGLVNEDGDRIIHPRVFVSLIAFFSTWWLPFISGVVFGFFNLIQSSWRKLFQTSFVAIMIAVLITIISELIGLFLGIIFLSKLSKSFFVDWCFIPDNLQHFENYIAVGSMDIFSFIGGIIGLVLGIFYSYKKRS